MAALRSCVTGDMEFDIDKAIAALLYLAVEIENILGEMLEMGEPPKPTAASSSWAAAQVESLRTLDLSI